MSSHFSPTLIKQLIPLMSQSNFHSLFEKLTHKESSSNRFLIKMELQRLTSTCHRKIDLREKTELSCTLFQQTHYLDEPAKQAFIDAVNFYHGQYTLGVYEQVLATHKQRISMLRQGKSDHQKVQSFLAQRIPLGHYFNRSEERMNYAMRIKASQRPNNTLSGISLDLSVHGAKIRLPQPVTFNKDNPIHLTFIDLSREYLDPMLKEGLCYQIIEIESHEKFAHLRLKRLPSSPHIMTLLARIIKNHKFRYKVDSKDVLNSATGLGFECHYLPHQPHLALFAELHNGQPHISHSLLSRANKNLWRLFDNEKHINQISNILSSKRLSSLINAIDDNHNNEHGLFFYFTTGTKNKTTAYSATLYELKQSQSLGLFFHLGSQRKSWRVFKTSIHKINHQKPYKAGILPGDHTQYSALTETQLGFFSHVIQVIDLTGTTPQADYASWKNQYESEHNKNSHSIRKISTFRHIDIIKSHIKTIQLHVIERRYGIRFQLNTTVTVQQGKFITTAVTDDISTNGLKIILNSALPFDPKQTIFISFPRLQRLAPKISLQKLPYHIMDLGKDNLTLHLKVLSDGTQHAGIAFLDKLIDKNKDKLKKNNDKDQEIKELADGMKNLFLRQLITLPFFLEKTVKSARVSTLAVGESNTALANTFLLSTLDGATTPPPLAHSHIQQSELPREQEYDLSILLKDNKLSQYLINPIRQMKPHHPFQFFDVWLHIKGAENQLTPVEAKQEYDFSNTVDKVRFIQQSSHEGQFMALRIYRGATGKPDLSYIRRERDYLDIHAYHKKKQLEAQLWRIIGVGEIIDITEEVILRYPELHSDK